MDADSQKCAQVPTSAVTFVETQHGRERREQRGMDKKDLQRAQKYGTREHGPWPQTTKCTHKDIIHIVDTNTGKEVTRWAKPLGLKQVKLSPAKLQEHAAAT